MFNLNFPRIPTDTYYSDANSSFKKWKKYIYIHTYIHTHKSIFLILVAERCSQQHETRLTLIMNLETLATLDRYVYVGLARSRRLFFPANLHRDLESATRDTPLAEQDGGTSWRGRGARRGRGCRKKKEIGLVTHDNVRRRHDG